MERNESRLFAIKFFLHGWRHINQEAAARILRLAPGEDLSVALEVTNPATVAAVQLQTRDRILIGWAPRYLIDDLIKVITSCPVAAKVSRVNLPPAPPSQRVLVLFEGCWPEGYEPMSGLLFQPLVTAPEQVLTQAS